MGSFSPPVRAGRPGWAVLSLTDRAFDLTTAELERDLGRFVDGAVFYFPASRSGKLDPEHPLSHYGFIVATPSDAVLRGLARSRCIASVLTEAGRSRVTRITDTDMRSIMRAQAGEDLRPGRRVLIGAGDFEGVEGTLVAVQPGRAQVEVTFCSRTSRVWCPRNQLTLIPKR